MYRTPLQGMRCAGIGLSFIPTLLQICDFDLCDTCVRPAANTAPSPPMARLPSPRVLLAIVSPFRGTLVAPILSSVRDAETINISSDNSPPPPKIHPFFIRRQAQLAEETHEMRFHAIARQPAPAASPLRRATGRMRLRVSTPVFPENEEIELTFTTKQFHMLCQVRWNSDHLRHPPDPQNIYVIRLTLRTS